MIKSKEAGLSLNSSEGRAASPFSPDLFAYLSLAFIFISAVFVFFSLELDDPYITFRYGKNLLVNHVYLWNAGEPPVEGYTSFLWTFIGTLAERLHISPMLPAKIIGVSASLVSLAYIIFGLRKYLPSLIERFTAGFLFVVCSDIILYSLTGMENILFPALILVLFHNLLDTEEKKPLYAAVKSAFIIVFMCLIRPEAHAIGALLFLRYLILVRMSGVKNYRPLFVFSSICFISLAVFHGFRFFYYGDLLPNTYYAKHSGGTVFDTLTGGALYFGQNAQAYLVFLVLSSLLVFRKGSNFARESISWFAYSVILMFVFYIFKMGGDDAAAFPGLRLALPVLPLLFILGVRGISEAVSGRGRAAVLVLLAAGFLMCQAPVYLHQLKIALSATNMTRNLLSKMIEKDRQALQGLLHPQPLALSAYLLRETPPGEAIAIPWVGRISYETMLPVIDMLGINDRHIAGTKKKQMGIDVKYDAEYILSRRPYFICESFPALKKMKMENIQKMTDEQIYQLGAWKIGQRELLKSPLLHQLYEVAENVPGTDHVCFERKSVE